MGIEQKTYEQNERISEEVADIGLEDQINKLYLSENTFPMEEIVDDLSLINGGNEDGREILRGKYKVFCKRYSDSVYYSIEKGEEKLTFTVAENLIQIWGSDSNGSMQVFDGEKRLHSRKWNEEVVKDQIQEIKKIMEKEEERYKKKIDKMQKKEKKKFKK